MNTKTIKSGSVYKVDITTDRSGRMSAVFYDGVNFSQRIIIDVELPAKSGEFKDAFKPTVKVSEEIETEKLK